MNIMGQMDKDSVLTCSVAFIQSAIQPMHKIKWDCDTQNLLTKVILILLI